MNTYLSLLIVVLLSIEQSHQDVYLHNPRGSNNRLNENTDARRNGARVFDSQNNDRGGYNVGDAGRAAATNEDQQYQMKYFESGVVGGSFLNLEWTGQHGCGVQNNLVNIECNYVLQYMCQPDGLAANNPDRLRDGTTTNTQNYVAMGVDNQTENAARKVQSVTQDRVLQETWESYDDCRYRNRNAGLFTADQNLKNNNKGYSSASFTRQNANGNRNGYECAEERDYYPYWHPSAWKDIAVLVTNTTLCGAYRAESFNVRPRNKCVETYPRSTVQKHWSRWNNQADCARNNGTWTTMWNYLEKAPQFTTQATCEANAGYKWAIPYDSRNTAVLECLVLLAAPECRSADFSRFNHLGNTINSNPAQYRWRLPHFPSSNVQKCAFRLRYNISNLDYDQYRPIDSARNGANSPIRNNPQVAVGPVTLRMAINTAQTGRVFQDRSHSFFILPRPSTVPDQAIINNLNVKGKRGNIVQTFPATEYDFIPHDLRINQNELVHIQWTGSNTNNPNNAGQGQAGTDRSNFVLVNNWNQLYPIQNSQSTFFQDVEFLGLLSGQRLTNDSSRYLSRVGTTQDLSVYLSSSAFYDCIAAATCAKNTAAATKVDADLNTAPASVPGALIRFTKANSTYYYMSSRNNAFSNRNQYGMVRVN